MVAGLFLAGCGSVVATEDVEELVEVQIAGFFGLPVEDLGEVSCPDTLDAEVGKETTCIYSLDGLESDVVVRVKSVSGSTASIEIVSIDGESI